METLSHPRDHVPTLFAPLIGILLLYVLVAAALLGNVLQHANPANEIVFVGPEVTVPA